MSKLYDLLAAMCGKIKKTDYNQNDPTAPDYVKNRPFYDTRESVTIKWDGNTDGRKCVSFNGESFCKVSDATPSMDNCMDGAVTFVVGASTSVTVTKVEPVEGLPAFLCGCVFSGNTTATDCLAVISTAYEYDEETYEPGVYFKYAPGGAYCKSFDCVIGELKQLDSKFLRGAYIVTLSKSTANGTTTYSVDKPCDEIIRAFIEGRTVLLWDPSMGNKYMQMDATSYDSAYFYDHGISGVSQFSILSNGNVFLRNIQY